VLLPAAVVALYVLRAHTKLPPVAWQELQIEGAPWAGALHERVERQRGDQRDVAPMPLDRVVPLGNRRVPSGKRRVAPTGIRRLASGTRLVARHLASGTRLEVGIGDRRYIGHPPQDVGTLSSVLLRGCGGPASRDERELGLHLCVRMRVCVRVWRASGICTPPGVGRRASDGAHGPLPDRFFQSSDF
jgi:hypothetical protein